MSAVNKAPWVKNLGGDEKPVRMLIPVDAGSSYAIKRGEICKIGKNTTGCAGPVTTASDCTYIVIADEEQKSTDVARMMHFIVPRPEDVFEFALSAAFAVTLGQTYSISDSQTLAIGTSNILARIAGDENCPAPAEKSVTRRSLSYARVIIDLKASYWSALTGNS